MAPHLGLGSSWKCRPREPRIQLIPEGDVSEESDLAAAQRSQSWRRWGAFVATLILAVVGAYGTRSLMTQSAMTPVTVDRGAVSSKAAARRGREAPAKATEAPAASLSLLQFNPHWECFNGPNMHTCGKSVFKLVTGLLRNQSVDFANIIELPKKYRPPDGWLMHCRDGGGGDTDCLLWRSAAWEVIGPNADCWWGNGRACNVMTFQRVGQDLKVTVLGAHFPHGAGTRQYYDFAGTVRWNLGKSKGTTDKVIVLADSNAGLHQKSDVGLLEDLGSLPSHVHVPTLWYDFRTCCHNIGYHGFFDRIAANFGKKLDLVRDANYESISRNSTQAPPFAQINYPNSAAPGAYHQPVMARLTL